MYIFIFPPDMEVPLSSSDKLLDCLSLNRLIYREKLRTPNAATNHPL